MIHMSIRDQGIYVVKEISKEHVSKERTLTSMNIAWLQCKE
jgi:hypothetical protein